MLIRYFLKNFLYYGLLFFAILTGIFASCNLFIRLPFINDAATIPMLMLTMLPLMTLFSLPLSSSMAVSMTIGQHQVYDEFLVLKYLKPARTALLKAVLIFSGICTFIYLIMVFQLAPQSYHKGKQLLLKVAQEQLLKLEPNKFHTPFSSCTFFFRKKVQASGKIPTFSTLFLVFLPKKGTQERYFFTAQYGYLMHDRLILCNGSMYMFKSGRFHSATFKQSDIDLHRFIEAERERPQLSGLKFLTWNRLLAALKTETEVVVEFHKRIVQALWQFLFPLLIFFLGSIVTYYSLLSSIITCGSLYLLSYVLIACAQVYSSNVLLALLLLYLPPLLLLMLGIVFYVRKQA